VTALAVVEDLEILEDRVGEFDSGLPAFAVEELDQTNWTRSAEAAPTDRSRCPT
jgi:hypothetical protein